MPRNQWTVLCTCLLLVLFVGTASAAGVKHAGSPDGMWRQIPSTSPSSPDDSSSYELNQNTLEAIITRAPLEFTNKAKALKMTMALPMPNGSYTTFRIEESPILADELAASFPGINTYKGVSVDDPTVTMRFDRTPLGFHAIVLSTEGAVFVEPEHLGDTRHYVSYRAADVAGAGFDCGVASFGGDPGGGSLAVLTHSGSSGDTLRTYRLAVAATGEYTQFFGGQANAVAAITTTVNNVNAIYNRDVAVQLNLVANTNLVVWPDPATDPYPLVNRNAEVQADLDNTIGNANYDIGHLFDASGFSGNAGCIGCICTNATKGSGWSRSSSPTGSNFTFLVSHEMGHQHGANHSWNGTMNSCSGETSPARYELGSGTTIMSYSSICGSDNIKGSAVGDLYLHAGSRRQIVHYLAGGGSSCATNSATGNGIPTISASTDYTIPQGTPFVLTASGSDPNSDPLTYCWEQYDIGPKAALNAVDQGSIPLFRSFPPTSSTSRTLPQYSDLLAGTANLFPNKLGEQLPSTNRTMDFRVTARDNASGTGAADDDLMTVTVSGSAFDVTSPDGGDPLECGTDETVSWNVGGGSVAPTVDILLSTNGGNTFPTSLASGTANDGSEVVSVPQTLSTNARVRINSVGNIFFNISDSTGISDTLDPDVTCPANVTVECDAPTDPGATGTATATDACDPNPVVSFSDTVVAGACPDESEITRGWTATDDSGNSASCDQVVDVVDTTAPAIACPADITVECSATGGTPKGDAQLVPFFNGVSATDNCDGMPTFGNDAPGLFPNGVTTTVTFTATDNCGNTSSCMTTVTVEDTTPPEFTKLEMTPDVLWPPNHKMWTINAEIEVVDICDPDPSVTLISATSSEPDNGIGDGNTINDIQDAVTGDDDREFSLRAERRGNGSGRIYTIVYRVTDADGNFAEDSAEVRVPHDQSGMAMAAAGFNPDGTSLDLGALTYELLIPSVAGLTDAEIDPSRVYVGNYNGVQTPLDARMVTSRNGGLLGLLLTYDAGFVGGLLDASNAPIGLHYTSGDGTDYAVPSIFGLGLPVPITNPPPAALPGPITNPPHPPLPANGGTDIGTNGGRL